MIDRIVDKLVEAIDQMPLLSMVSSVRVPRGAEDSEVKKLVTEAINALSALAKKDDKDAAIALRGFENREVNKLSFLVSDPTAWTERKNRVSPVGDSPVYHTVYSLPLLKIEGDLSPIKDILKSEAKAIGTLSEEDIRTHVGGPRIAGRRQCVVNALSALGIPEDVFNRHRCLTSEESVCYDHPVSILEMLYADVERSKDAFAMKKRQECTRIAMHEIIGYLLEDQLSKLLKVGLGELPSNSFPLRFVSRGNFDNGAGNREKPTAGRPRRITPGDPAHFALEYCMALDDVRRLHIDSSDTQRDEIKATISRIENLLKETEKVAIKIAREGNTEKINNLTKQRQMLYQGQTLRILWTCKAALLPEFPYPERDSDPAAEEALKLWIDAAVARARMLCRNDWEHYRGWPNCVETRRAQKTAFSAVSEKLKEGMKRLELVGTTAP